MPTLSFHDLHLTSNGTMSETRRAVIDVGTNSVKVLVADVVGTDVRPLLEQSEQTRLGRGFYQTRRLQPQAIEQTACAVANFGLLATQWGAGPARVIATSAARDALNQRDLIDAIRNRSGLPVEVVSGEQEAQWAYHGVASDPQLAGSPLMILDVGGGSTEFILGEGPALQFCQSFSLGTVRLLEELQLGDLPSEADLSRCRLQLARLVDEQIIPSLSAALPEWSRERVQLVGTGGTPTMMAAIELCLAEFDRGLIEAVRLSCAQVERQVSHLWNLPLAARQCIVGLPPNRADVILTGAAIYEAVLARFGFPELRVSTRGLRYAVLMEATFLL